MTSDPNYSLDTTESSRRAAYRPERASDWPPAKVSELKKHWDSGLPIRKIAAQMGIAPGAVSGKVRRLGLEKRGGSPRKFAPDRPISRKRIHARARAAAAQALKAPKPAPIEAPPANPVSFFDLARGMCRYQLPDGMFCAGATAKTYCPTHARIVYEPARPRR